MGFLSFFKKLLKLLFRNPITELEGLTPEIFTQKRTKMYPKDYGKWLKIQYTYFGTVLLERKTKKLIISQSWIDKLKMIEKEMEDLEKSTGFHLFEKKLSEEFQQYKHLVP